MGFFHEIESAGSHFRVDSLHPFHRQGAGVLYPAISVRMNNTPGAELLAKCWILWVVDIFRLVLGVEVVQVAEELVEAVIGGQVLIAVTQVILAELAGGIAVIFQQAGKCRVFFAHTFFRAGKPNLGQAGTKGRLAGNKRSAPGGAALLTVPVGEHGALIGDPVDIGCLVSHHPVVVGADIEPANIVAPNH